MPPADPGDPFEVVAGGYERAGVRTDDGLDDEGRDLLRADLLEHPLDLVGASDVAGRKRLAHRAAHAVVRGRSWLIGLLVDQPVLEAGPAALVSADGQRCHRGAVVGEIAPEHPPALGAPRRQVVLAGEPDREIHRLGTAAREQDAVDVAGQPAGPHPVDQLRSRRGREGRHDVVGLRRGPSVGLRHFPPSVSDVRDDGASGGVEDPATRGRDHVAALGGHNLQWRLPPAQERIVLGVRERRPAGAWGCGGHRSETSRLAAAGGSDPALAKR